MIEISQTCLREKNNNRKILTKHVTRQNHILIAKYWILREVISDQKHQKLPPFGKFVSKLLIFAAANNSFSNESGIYR